MKICGPFSFRHGAQRGVEREPAAERIARMSATHGSAEGGRAGQEGEGLAGRSLMATPLFGTMTNTRDPDENLWSLFISSWRPKGS